MYPASSLSRLVNTLENFSSTTAWPAFTSRANLENILRRRMLMSLLGSMTAPFTVNLWVESSTKVMPDWMVLGVYCRYFLS